MVASLVSREVWANLCYEVSEFIYLFIWPGFPTVCSMMNQTHKYAYFCILHPNPRTYFVY